jgi:ribonuclease P protein component
LSRKTFHRAEKLKSRKAIEALFRKGQSFGQYPLRLVFMPLTEATNQTSPVQLAVTVSKKKFSKAVHRNRIKRQVKEAWRLNKGWLYHRLPDDTPPLAMMVIYVANEPLPYDEIERAIKGIARRVLKKVKSQNDQPKYNK